MHYCLSDLHGEEARFQAMLERIAFSPADTLYILGDVIDRRPGGVALLRQIMAAPNMVLLMGNHERMCLDTLGPQSVCGSRRLWQNNGGSSTFRELRYRSSPEERRRILSFLAGLPDHLEVEVAGQRYHLVHALPSEDPSLRLWGRPAPEDPAPFPDRTAVVGHTPTCFLTGDWENPLSIWRGRGIIVLDCGCGHQSPLGRLACLRLEDQAEFYV